jgi:hypothetical protein
LAGGQVCHIAIHTPSWDATSCYCCASHVCFNPRAHAGRDSRLPGVPGSRQHVSRLAPFRGRLLFSWVGL